MLLKLLSTNSHATQEMEHKSETQLQGVLMVNHLPHSALVQNVEGTCCVAQIGKCNKIGDAQKSTGGGWKIIERISSQTVSLKSVRWPRSQIFSVLQPTCQVGSMPRSHFTAPTIRCAHFIRLNIRHDVVESDTTNAMTAKKYT